MSGSDAGKATAGSLAFLFMTIGAFVALLSFAGNAGAVVRSGGTGTDPWISSELPDYAPGSTVNLLGGSWQPGEAVHIHVNDSAGQTWARDVDITANSTGDISDTFTLPDWFVANYSVTATGTSGSFATSTFTDSQPQAVTVAAPTSVSVTAGNTANFGTVSVQVNGNASNCTITLSTAAVAGDTGLPAGATPSLTNNPNTTNANYTSSLSVSSEASVPAGTYTFHVTATRAADCQGNGVVISTQQLILTVSSPCTAPSVTTQPSDQSIIYGANASFMAGASGSPAPTVQWQVNNGSGFTGIGGATSSTLSLSKPLVSASGNHYRAVFSNSCGSVNSDAATLTVAAKNLTVTGVTAFDKVYDGTTSATIDTSSADLNGVVSGDSVTLGTGGASGAFLSKTVGTAKTVQIWA